MSESVGVLAIGRYHGAQSVLDSIKRLSLFFDKIALHNLESARITEELFPNDNSSFLLDEIDYLIDQGICFDVGLQVNEVHEEIIIPDYFSVPNRDEFKKSSAYSQFIQLSKYVKKNLFGELGSPPVKVTSEYLDLSARFVSSFLREYSNFESYPILKKIGAIESDYFTKKADTIHLVCNKFPVPMASTPWEDILSFRNDKTIRRNYFNFRDWINKISKEKLSPDEIEVRLESLIGDFERYVEVEKSKLANGTFETVVNLAADVADNLVRVRFKNISQAIFSIKKRKFRLLEIESDAPGKEIAYLVKAQERFG
jgi:hypothetical protein